MTDLLKNEALSDVVNASEQFLKFVDSPSNIEAKKYFQEIANHMMVYIKAVEKYCNETKPNKIQHLEIVSHLMKICGTCELFGSKYLNLNNSQEKFTDELQKCISKQLTLLLNGFPDVICKKNKSDIGIFVHLMNVTLENISQIDIEKGRETANLKLDFVHNMIEEILCFAMAIAQVAAEDDHKVITSRCRLVLQTLGDIKTEINKAKPNTYMCNLTIDNCTDALCALEAQVNMAVLRLCLRIFSDSKDSLENFISNISQETAISNFDYNMDCISQIALFSIASSSIGKGVAALKVAIFNLEFLERELVPIVITENKMNLNQTKPFADLLRKFWCEQVSSLRKTIHMIIEPSAYCKLVLEKLQSEIDSLWLSITSSKSITASQLQPFIKCTEELSEMIMTCIHCFRKDQIESIRKQLKVLNCMLKEVKSCAQILNQSKASDMDIFKFSKSSFKRCQVLVKAIKYLWLCAANETEKADFSGAGELLNDNTIEGANEQLTYIANKSKHLVKMRAPYNTTFHSEIYLDGTYTKTKSFGRQSIYHNREEGDVSLLNDIYPSMEVTFSKYTVKSDS